MVKGIFITGSGTGVGKTFISRLMLQEFLRMGHRTTYMKPVETGCLHHTIGDDVRGMLDIIEYKTNVDLHSPYRFEPACSPHLAARMAGAEINIGHIVSSYKKLCEETSADIVIVEGAGGLLVPVNNNEYVADIISALGIPAVIVTQAGLGTLNHTYLTVNELTRRGIDISGAVINNACNVERDFICADNEKEIIKYVAPAPCLIVNYNDSNHDNTNLTEFCNAVSSRF